MAHLDDIYPPNESHPLTSLDTVNQIFQVIPPTNLRDQIMFRLIGELGLRAIEILTLRVEDVDLAKQPLHLIVRRKAAVNNKTIPVTSSLDTAIRQYLAQIGYQQGPLFRAQKKKREEPLRFQSLYEIWTNHCATAGVSLSLHDLQRLASPSRQHLHQPREQLETEVVLDDYGNSPIQDEPRPPATVAGQERHSRQLIPVYLDIEAVATGASNEGNPWRFTKLEFGYCTYVAYADCPHRLMCPHCAFFRLPEDILIHIRKPERHIQRLLQELELSEAELNILENKPGAVQQLREQLMDVPTPAGPTPRQLRDFASSSEYTLQQQKK